ncbi:uncharacterized protein [Littorina saxatilis]|uniref:uncharacterized protein n=1 Tax=Littorina saxatilis TaxID=31220 RepID=UPI0038B5616B
MSLYPLLEKHSEATFRCYLVVNMTKVSESLRGTYRFGKVGAPHYEKPLRQRYEYTTTSLLTFLLGFIGFIVAFGASIFYFLNKKYRCFARKTGVPTELLEEEKELAELEEQFNEALQADTKLHAAARASPFSGPLSSGVDDPSVAESSVVEDSSVVESSAYESSVMEMSST